MANKYVKNASEGAKGTDHARIHKRTQGRKVQEDEDKIKEKHGMKSGPRPRHKHAHTLSLGNDNKKLHKVWQGCYGKKKQRRLSRPLYGENTRQRGMLSKTLGEKKRETQGTTRKNNQPTPQKACTRSLSTGGKKRGVTNREVCITRYSYHTFLLHVYRTSSIAFLLLFDHDHADRRREPTKV